MPGDRACPVAACDGTSAPATQLEHSNPNVPCPSAVCLGEAVCLDWERSSNTVLRARRSSTSLTSLIDKVDMKLGLVRVNYGHQ